MAAARAAIRAAMAGPRSGWRVGDGDTGWAWTRGRRGALKLWMGWYQQGLVAAVQQGPERSSTHGARVARGQFKDRGHI
jgi:hypothetical protein